MSPSHPVERRVEQILLASRFLLVPCYLGLIGTLGMVAVKFFQELIHYMPMVFAMTEADLILAVLSLVDLTLTANLILMVILSGYENSVSQIDLDDDQESPEWLGSLDFGGLKMKLIASMVAISGIHLLKVFLHVQTVDADDIRWMVIIHMAFVFSGVLMAVMDWIKARTKVALKA